MAGIWILKGCAKSGHGTWDDLLVIREVLATKAGHFNELDVFSADHILSCLPHAFHHLDVVVRCR